MWQIARFFTVQNNLVRCFEIYQPRLAIMGVWSKNGIGKGFSAGVAIAAGGSPRGEGLSWRARRNECAGCPACSKNGTATKYRRVLRRVMDMRSPIVYSTNSN
jgi:hypothetical protein